LSSPSEVRISENGILKKKKSEGKEAHDPV
jgi:hypothetical protein